MGAITKIILIAAPIIIAINDVRRKKAERHV
jgi:hypothetical protein